MSLTPLLETTTDAQGRFEFVGHERHFVVLTATKDGHDESPRYPIRLYFRNQNRALSEPLTLGACRTCD